MLVQTLRRCMGLGLLLGLGGTTSWSREPKPQPVSISVSVYDDAGVGRKTLQRAEQISSMIFQHAGIEVQWLNCGVDGKLTHVSYWCGSAVYPTHLQLRIVNKSQGLHARTMGLSYLSSNGQGCYSLIFLRSVEQLQMEVAIDLPVLLGHVATHEIAHLLLGSSAHAATGIMRAHWAEPELLQASKGLLLFDSGERERMVAQVAEGIRKEQLALAARGDPSGTD